MQGVGRGLKKLISKCLPHHFNLRLFGTIEYKYSRQFFVDFRNDGFLLVVNNANVHGPPVVNNAKGE